MGIFKLSRQFSAYTAGATLTTKYDCVQISIYNYAMRATPSEHWFYARYFAWIVQHIMRFL